MKYAKYILFVALGIGIGSLGMLALGYEQPIEKDPVRLIRPMASDSNVPTLPVVQEDDELIRVNKKLDKKLDRLADSLSSLKAKIDSLNIPNDSNSVYLNDSTSSILDSFNIQGEDIVVERDQLFSTHLLKVSYLNDEKSTDSNGVMVDSLKSELNIQPQKKPEYLEIEQWKSPLNFEGYKLSKTKLIIYGMINELILEVSSQNDKLFVKTNEGLYEMVKSTSFRDLKKVE